MYIDTYIHGLLEMKIIEMVNSLKRGLIYTILYSIILRQSRYRYYYLIVVEVVVVVVVVVVYYSIRYTYCRLMQYNILYNIVYIKPRFKEFTISIYGFHL